MAYVGLNPQTQLLNTSTQTFSGNAVNLQFTLARSVASASDLDVMIDHELQRPFTDYEAENTSLQFQSAPASGTNNITVTYRAGALNSLNLTANAFGAGTVGAPSVYSVAANNTGLYWPNATTVGIAVAGANTVLISGNANSTSSTTGALQVAGGIGATGNINTAGIVKITNTTNSANVSTGALVVAGSIGVAGNVTIGQNITCVGDFTVNGTFTTTGTDSLDVNDPFIFLANANPGDTYDTGVISQYYDGVANRYTGYFRDITDNKYKLFGNLLTKPTTVVDTSAPSFKYQDLVLANVSATGNVNGTYFLGNGALLTGIITSVSSVTNGTSGLFVPALNGNVITNIGGATIATVSSSIGLAVTGNVNATTGMSATGNVVGGNVTTSGIISGTGNITSAANVSGGNLLTGGLISAAGAITVTAVSATTGNVSAVGNIIGGNVLTAGQASAGGNITGLNLKTAGIVSAAGAVYGSTLSINNDISAGTSIAATTSITAGTDISATGSVSAGTTVSATGNITGSYFLGNGRLLSGIDSTAINNGTSNVKVVAANANVTVNIGGTSNVAVFATTGEYVTGLISASGNVTGSNFTTGGIVSATGNIIGGNLSGTSIVGTLTTAAQTNITSVGTLSGLNSSGVISATGNVTGGNINTSGLVSAGTTVSAGGNVTGGNIITNGLINAGGVISATGNVTGGNINTAGLVSSVGNVTNGIANVLTGNAIVTSLVQAATLSATGNIIGGNLNATGLSLSGNVVSGLSMITNITTTANVTGGNVLSSGVISTPGTVTGATVNATTFNGSGSGLSSLNGSNISSGTIPSAPISGSYTGITGVGTLTVGTWTASSISTTYTAAKVTDVAGRTGSVSLAQADISGLTTASSPTFAGLTVPAIAHSGTNGVGDIGSGAQSFATVYATTFSGVSTTAKYADLAENYSADAKYTPGTVLDFGGNQEVTLSTTQSSSRVAGVVSTDPAHLMNGHLVGDHVVALALTGRVPTNVIGKVRKGDMMVSAGAGCAQACTTPAMGTVIGKALENFDGDQGTIEIVVGRL